MQKYDRFLQKSVEQKNSRSLETKIVGIIRRDNFFFFFFFRFSIVSWFYRNILFETTKCRCVRKYRKEAEGSSRGGDKFEKWNISHNPLILYVWFEYGSIIENQ